MRAVSLSALEDALKSADSQTRHRTLTAVADLFLGAASGLSEEKIEVFDQIFSPLIEHARRPELMEISRTMAPIENAPRKLIKALAENSDISIAAPVLSQSARLSTDDLCQIAGSKSNLHMLAISCRPAIDEPISDILLERGDQAVARSVAANTGAKLSQRGIERLRERAKEDHMLVKELRERERVSQEALREAKARLAGANKDKSKDADGSSRSGVLAPDDVSEAQIVIFALQKDYEGVIAALSALAKLSCETVENMMQPNRISGIVLICKAAGLAWKTADAVLTVARSRNRIGDEEALLAHREFINLTRSTAERIIRFWQVRESISVAN